ncbi:hypothetical protein [Gilvimarinus sp. 1_MG-2023]|uniref:hypothetical protein n=1 Tax=Gilvimarinus sp. 1_MG-2023 TaxID=3062638 RepID=UPI0026E2C998|nr:hypothetical protein [Gilvimarinus sp. 1_MG-2023]MDO6747219.1 hypothetical protein [Gilvimarinus sp. 1_MG-2023]
MIQTYQYIGAISPNAYLYQPLGTNLPSPGQQFVIAKSPVSGTTIGAGICAAGSQGARIDLRSRVGEIVDLIAHGLSGDNSLYYKYGVEVTDPMTVSFDVAFGTVDQTINSKVAGQLRVAGEPVKRVLRAFSYDSVTHTTAGASVDESRTLGSTVSSELDGSYELELQGGFEGDVFVVAFDDYGQPFTASASVAEGDRIHPTTPNGLVYEVTADGVLPASEPVWSTDTENAQTVGTASVMPTPFYRPLVHGPVTPNSEPI